jgi:hypothetical protein
MFHKYLAFEKYRYVINVSMYFNMSAVYGVKLVIFIYVYSSMTVMSHDTVLLGPIW